MIWSDPVLEFAVDVSGFPYPCRHRSNYIRPMGEVFVLLEASTPTTKNCRIKCRFSQFPHVLQLATHFQCLIIIKINILWNLYYFSLTNLKEIENTRRYYWLLATPFPWFSSTCVSYFHNPKINFLKWPLINPEIYHNSWNLRWPQCACVLDTRKTAKDRNLYNINNCSQLRSGTFD